MNKMKHYLREIKLFLIYCFKEDEEEGYQTYKKDKYDNNDY